MAEKIKRQTWKPAGSNDFTSTYLRRAEMILNQEKTPEPKKEEKKPEPIIIPVKIEENARPNWKPPGSGNNTSLGSNRVRFETKDKYNKNSQRGKNDVKETIPTVFTQRPPDLVLIHRQPQHLPPVQKSYPQPTSSNRIVIETTIEHTPSQTFYARPATAYRVLVPTNSSVIVETDRNSPEQYVERVYYPETGAYYVYEPVRVPNNS